MWFKTSKQSQRPYPPIMVGDVVLNVVTNQRYLGLVFDQIYPGTNMFHTFARECLIIYMLFTMIEIF